MCKIQLAIGQVAPLYLLAQTELHVSEERLMNYLQNTCYVAAWYDELPAGELGALRDRCSDRFRLLSAADFWDLQPRLMALDDSTMRGSDVEFNASLRLTMPHNFSNRDERRLRNRGRRAETIVSRHILSELRLCR
jgi:hypothetical protein